MRCDRCKEEKGMLQNKGLMFLCGDCFPKVALTQGVALAGYLGTMYASACVEVSVDVVDRAMDFTDNVVVDVNKVLETLSDLEGLTDAEIELMDVCVSAHSQGIVTLSLYN